MLIIMKQRFGWLTGPRVMRAESVLAVLGSIVVAVFSIHAHAAVIEYFNPDLNNYFITADPVEQDFVDTGAVGRWQRTGNAFAAGGPNQVCRFGGNSAINPATGTFYGPNSHFYTADAAECAGLKAIYTPSAKSWKFESNDFRITPVANGACPAGLTPVYRAYNNGFAKGIDSNHRITSNQADYLQTVAAGSIGEGVVMCAPSPAPTAAGVANGSVASATIGAAGGSVGTADGRITVTIPAGALAADTLIGIQPLANTAHGKIGAAYRLTPDGQAFSMPVTLKFVYADQDLVGSSAEALGAAYQSVDGYWRWAGDPTLDATAKTVSIATTHFSDWSLVKGLQLYPPTAVVKVNGSQDLQVTTCYDPVAPDPRGYECDQAAVALAVNVSEWSVNGVPDGGLFTGTVSGNGPNGTFTAPPAVPFPPTVTVSARVNFGKKGTPLAKSDITIVNDSWTGTASAHTPEGYSATAQVTWIVQSTSGNVVLYRPTGTVSVTIPPCTINPSSGTINPASDGFLEIDYGAHPATYHGTAGSLFTAVYTCPTGTFSAMVPAGFFGGSQGASGTEAQGQVSADGKTIEGTDTHPSGQSIATFNWRFTRNQ